MDTELEIERITMERARVMAARLEMAYNIKQRQAEIKRLQANIDIQLAKEAELTTTLAKLATPPG